MEGAFRQEADVLVLSLPAFSLAPPLRSVPHLHSPARVKRSGVGEQVLRNYEASGYSKSAQEPGRFAVVGENREASS
jgi:hypothetical protein